MMGRNGCRWFAFSSSVHFFCAWAPCNWLCLFASRQTNKQIITDWSRCMCVHLIMSKTPALSLSHFVSLSHAQSDRDTEAVHSFILVTPSIRWPQPIGNFDSLRRNKDFYFMFSLWHSVSLSELLDGSAQCWNESLTKKSIHKARTANDAIALNKNKYSMTEMAAEEKSATTSK